MVYPFYQRIVPMNHLVHVGDFDVPEEMLEVPLPVYDPSAVWMASQMVEGPHYIPPRSTGQVVRYFRKKGEIFDCFVGEVKAPATV